MTPDLERAFALIEAAAIGGFRCPQNQPHGPLKMGETTKLARAGYVRFEIYRHNYRVATILKGPHEGKHTLRPKELKGLKPFRVGDTTGFYQAFWRR